MNNITNSQNMNIEMLVGQVKRGTIRLDHPLQRCAQQWSLNQKGGIISRILFGLDIIPLKICVQMNSGCELKWLIDGKQRITTVMEFMDNQFKIPSSCRYAYVEYHGKKYETVTCRGKERYKKDRNGNFIAVRDENGNEVTGVCIQY